MVLNKGTAANASVIIRSHFTSLLPHYAVQPWQETAHSNMKAMPNDLNSSKAVRRLAQLAWTSFPIVLDIANMVEEGSGLSATEGELDQTEYECTLA